MRKLLLIVVVILFIFSCKSSSTVTPTPDTSKPVVTFSVSPTTIHKGDSATLSWSVTNANSISINNNIGSVSVSGTKTETPTTTTTYTLTASNNNGQTTASVTLTVQLTPPTINSFTADDSRVQPGNTTTLRWSVSNANTIRILHNAALLLDNLQASGSAVVTPTNLLNTYRLEATNNDGTVYREIQVSVNYPAVTYKAFGVSSADITISTASGGTAQYSAVSLPWTYEMPYVATGTFLYVSAQSNETSGSITVEIWKYDTLYKTATSTGAYVIATASGEM
jgi:hypothetical protein